MSTRKLNTSNGALTYALNPVISRSRPETNRVHRTTNEPTRFLIHTKDDVRVILFEEVVCCTAESNYTIIYLTDGSKLLVSRTLKDIASVLCHPQFFRIHASHLVNLNLIKRILKTHQCMVELPNNLMVEVSRSRRDELMEKMETL